MKIIFTMVITFCSSLTFALTNSVPELSPAFQSGVLIKTDALQPDGEETLSFCNATFVHPRVLVTAAHCLQGAYILKSFNTEISVGYYKYITRPDGKTVRIGWVDVVKATAAGKYYFVGNLASSFNTSGMNVKIKPEQDIALIVLDQPFILPATTVVTSVLSKSEFSSIAASPLSYAPKIVTINFWVESSSDTKRSASLDNLKYSATGFFTSVATSRVEEGDSGAPLLVGINGEWKLAGVVKGRGQSIFGNWDAMTAADSKLCSLATQTKSVELQTLLCQ